MFRKFILIALLCLNSYKALAEDNKSKYVINNSIYVMESFKNKDSLVKNKKKYLKEGIKEKLLESIYFKDPALNSVKPSKENQANPFPNNKNQTDLFQPDFTKLDQNFPYNMHIKRQQKFLKDMQLRLPKSRFKSKKDGKYYPHQIYPYPEIKELY